MSKELMKKEVALGEYGSASVSVDSKAKVKVAMAAEIDLIAEVKKLAAQTKTTLDDAFIAQLEALVNAADSVVG